MVSLFLLLIIITSVFCVNFSHKMKMRGSVAFFIYLYEEARQPQLSRPGKPISITAVHSSLLQATKKNRMII